MTQTRQFFKQINFVVVTMTFLLGFGIDLYTPSFPEIVKDLKTTEQLVQLTIPFYLVGYTIGMLFLGPFSDSIGRRKALLMGLAFYCLMSFICSASPNIYLLLVFRFFQGIGISAIGVMYQSILSDVFTGKNLATSISNASMSNRVSPLIAPLIGGYITFYFDWQFNFYFLTVYGLFILLIVYFFLPETHHELAPFHPGYILKRYSTIIKVLPFLGAGICSGITYAMFIAFNLVAPFLIEDVLGYSTIAYGHIVLLLGIMAFLGSATNRFLLEKTQVRKIVRWGIYAVFFVTLIQNVFAYLAPVNLYSFIVPVGIISYLTGFIGSNMFSIVIQLIPHGKGTAKGLFGTLVISISFIVTALTSFLESGTVIPFALSFLAMGLVTVLSYEFLFKRKYLI